MSNGSQVQKRLDVARGDPVQFVSIAAEEVGDLILQKPTERESGGAGKIVCMRSSMEKWRCELAGEVSTIQ